MTPNVVRALQWVLETILPCLMINEIVLAKIGGLVRPSLRYSQTKFFRNLLATLVTKVVIHYQNINYFLFYAPNKNMLKILQKCAKFQNVTGALRNNHITYCS